MIVLTVFMILRFYYFGLVIDRVRVWNHLEEDALSDA